MFSESIRDYIVLKLILYSFEDDELPLHTFTIVTCDVNKQLSFLHDVSDRIIPFSVKLILFTAHAGHPGNAKGYSYLDGCFS